MPAPVAAANPEARPLDELTSDTAVAAARPRPRRSAAGARPGPTSAPAGPAGRRPRTGPEAAPADRSVGLRSPVVRAAPPGRVGPAARSGTTPEELARAFAHVYLEVECGRRGARQVARLMDPVLHARLESVWVRPGQPPGRIRRVHARRSTEGRIDAVVVVERGERAGVVALELRRSAGGWKVTSAARPEDGPLPPAPFTLPADDDLLDQEATWPAPAAPIP